MKDLNGEELEVGAIYIVPGSQAHVVISKYSHETEYSFVFKGLTKVGNEPDLTTIYSWKRVLSKWQNLKNIPVIKASQELIDNYKLV